MTDDERDINDLKGMLRLVEEEVRIEQKARLKVEAEVARLRADNKDLHEALRDVMDGNAALWDDLDRALDALGLTLDALCYMTAPTMARPGDRDPADFAMTDATEKDVRLALRTCIGMAVACLNNVEATGTPVEEVRRRRAVLAAHDREARDG